MKSSARNRKRRAQSGSLSLRGIGAALLFGLLWSTPSLGQTEIDTTTAAQVKAAFLRYIAEFTTWPQEVMGDGGDPIVLGTMGSDPHGVTAILQHAIDGRGLLAQNRRIVLRRMPEPDSPDFVAALEACHLLFLSGFEGVVEDWKQIRGLLVERPVVTIGEASGFSLAAGMIEFVIDEKTSRVTMHIDLEAVARAQLRLSSRLLGLKQGVKIVRAPVAHRESCVGSRCEPDSLGIFSSEVAASRQGPLPAAEPVSRRY